VRIFINYESFLVKHNAAAQLVESCAAVVFIYLQLRQ